MISVTQINNEVVRPIPPLDGVGNRPVKGADVIAEPYANIFNVAKKKSGKTNVTAHIIRKCMGKNTTVIVFASTLNKDANWLQLQRYFKRKKIPFIGYTSLHANGVDQLAELVEQLQEEADQEQRRKEEEELENVNSNTSLIRFDDEDAEEDQTGKLKYLAPEFIIVLDDLSSELQSASLVKLLKENRHFKCKIIINSQYLNDLLPESRKQLDVWILFKGHPIKKLQEIYTDADLSIDFNTFVKLYRDATSRPYGFLYIDTNNGTFRRNFSHQYRLPSD